MGRIYAEGITETDLSLADQIRWHLTGNHFPPIPVSMIPVCIAALDAANEEDWDRMISLPEGVGYKGLTAAPAHAIIEQHHLDPWLSQDDDTF
jgi:hypothetical protein